MKQPFGKHIPLKITLLILGSIVIVLLVIITIVNNKSLSPEFYEKDSFNSEEITSISNYIYVDPNKVSIDKGTFSHAKDSVFIFYLSNIQINDINSYFEKMYESKNDIIYQAKKNQNIKCILNDNTNTATIRVEEYNSDLYSIFKKSNKK
ncbi:hypothetical protein [Ruminococcus sp.]|uniref:hypothetical protein n=1 Tax=Ruminococcus sp. TaxID=41978 RepID=UPI0025DA4CF5|nr:hypothetical protein [Ruminococcus sp.]